MPSAAKSTAAAMLHPMRIVVQRTGLSPDVLRVWEKRYGVVKPVRSGGGQRYYTDADVRHLRLLVRAIEGGRSAGQVAKLPLSSLEALVEHDAEAARGAPLRDAGTAPDANDSVLAAALAAIDRFDASGMERVLRAATLRRGVDDVLDAIVTLLYAISDRRNEGRLRPAQEHLATSALRRTLAWMTENTHASASAPGLVVATPLGQQHELGAMLAAAAAASSGWHVVYLGVNLPAVEIAATVESTRARGVALSIVSPSADPDLPGELRALRQALPPNIRIVAGGSAAASYAAALQGVGAILLPNLAALRAWLKIQARER